MEQHELRQWEAQCTQEEAPHCRSRCPLHIDVRSFCQKMSVGKFNDAWAVLCKSMPVPQITARICDGECMERCLRKELGGSINMPELEKFCAEHATRTPPVRPLPSKGKHIAILGGGLTALAAAWDLAKKGFSPTVQSSIPFDGLEGRVATTLLTETQQALEKMGVTFTATSSLTDISAAYEEWDTVLIATEQLATKYNCTVTDDLTLQTTVQNVFSIPQEKVLSPIEHVAAGRKLALSAERYIQQVSLNAGRDTEGAYQSQLSTSLTSVSSLPSLPFGEAGYDETSAMLEAGRCIQCECMQCVDNCVYLKEFKSYPKVYARQIYNNAAIVMGTRHANTLINSCMLCGLCEEICPEDFAVQDLCLSSRQEMVEKGTMPPSAHEFALQDMEFANTKGALAKNAPDTTTSTYAFFPGCQLPAISPHLVEATYAFLQDSLNESVGLFIHCCGAPAHWAGQKELSSANCAVIEEEWKLLGKPEIITGCPTCASMFAELLPHIPTRSLWSIFEETGLPENTLKKHNLVLHDPCSTRHDEPMRTHVRSIAKKLDIDMAEPHLSGVLTECCGYGGLLDNVNPKLARKASDNRVQNLSNCTEEEREILTYCAMCRDMLARTGKRTLHLLDVLFANAKSSLRCCKTDPAGAPVTGHSDRRENRVRLKEHLLSTVWGQELSSEKATPDTLFSLTEDAAKNMEERRILKNDLNKVIAHVEATGKRIFDTTSQHYVASFRPVNVTYWIEFTKKDGTYLIHNTWSHRMQIITPR